jgi:CBS domain-containing protein
MGPSQNALMPQPTPPGFDFSQPPFDLLSGAEQQQLCRQLDLALFRRDQRIIEAGAASPFVYVILHGEVVASDVDASGESDFGDYRDGDLFGAFAVISGRARHRYRAIVDTLCFTIPDALFKQLLAANPRFSAYFLEALAVKKRLLRERDRPSDLAEVMLSRIRDGLVVPPVKLMADSSVAQAVRVMRDKRVDNVLVQLADTLGIVTRTDLLDALALQGASPQQPIGPLARAPLIGADENGLLFEALVTMTARRIHRIAVTRAGEVVGTLGLMEVLSHFSAKSHLINFRLEQAQSADDLRAIAKETTGLVRTLFAQGAKIRFLMDLVSALNTRMLAKAYELILPAGAREPTLLALGSEGRHEQILKTDQDNALILPDGAANHDYAAFADELSAFLLALGFPPCPGGVMVNNPVWRHDQNGWLNTLRRWIAVPDPQALMHLAIFFDAQVIAGPAEPFTSLRPAMFAIADHQAAMRSFAEPAVKFRTPLTLFGGLKGDDAGIDLKKGGIFPIVHGVRALALRERLSPTNSFARIDALIGCAALEQRSGEDLKQALSVLLRLRLSEQLAALSRGELLGNHIDPKQLRRLDLDLLRDALRVVREFQTWLRQSFQLE